MQKIRVGEIEKNKKGTGWVVPVYIDDKLADNMTSYCQDEEEAKTTRIQMVKSFKKYKNYKFIEDFQGSVIEIQEDVALQGLGITLERGDKIQVVQEADWEQTLRGFETEDYQHRGKNSPRPGKPDCITFYKNKSTNKIEVTVSFKSTSEGEAKAWVQRNVVPVLPGDIKYEIKSYQDGDYHDDWVDAILSIS